MPASLIAFDGDMTLWDFDKVMRHALGCALAELRRLCPGVAGSDLTVERMIDIRDRVAGEMGNDGVRLEAIRLEAFRHTLAAVDLVNEGLAAHRNAVYLRHRFEDIELYPDVLPTLDALAPVARLGLISNGNSYPERCGLAGRFAVVVFAQDVGCSKPGRAIFQSACTKAGCAPADLVHVGDSLASDVAGANAVGATSVWLNRDGRPNETSIRPRHEIRALAELPTALGLAVDGARHI